MLQYFDNLKVEILDHYNKEVEKLSDKIALLVELESRNITGQKFAGGNLQKLVRKEVKKAAGEYLIKVFSNVDYAQYRSEGTRSHFPLLVPLISWVRKKGLTGTRPGKINKYPDQNNSSRQFGREEDDRVIAWRIAKKISKKGTKGTKFFEIALKQALPKIEAELKNYPFAGL